MLKTKLSYLVTIGSLVTAMSASVAAGQLKPVEVKPVLSKGSKILAQSKRHALKPAYIIELNDRSLYSIKKERQQMLADKNAKFVAKQIVISEVADRQLQKRQQFVSELRALSSDAKVSRQYTELFNGLSIKTNLSVEQLEKLNNVKAVYPVQSYSLKLANALPIIKATEGWDIVGGQSEAGKGMKIAIIDSGITPDHPMFDDNGFTAPASVPENSYCSVDASFCNNKLIVARYFADEDYDFEGEGETKTPAGLSGHGTHVAGIAAGREVTTPDGETIVGVAPGAYIMAYKALWGQKGRSTDSELLAAVDAAAADGADVINNSWGGGSGNSPVNSLYNSVFAELEANNVIIVTAAGNEGRDGPQTISCPGCVKAGITVGATTTDKVSGNAIKFGGNEVLSTPGSNYDITADIVAPAMVIEGTNELGCTAHEANSLTGKIAIVKRGECFFEEKANNAAAAGAVGLVVVNSEAGRRTSMSMNSATLPATLVSPEDGKTLSDYVVANAAADITLSAGVSVGKDAAFQDWVAVFSSLGPNGDDSFIKPDLSAPGAGILSAISSVDEDALGLDYTELGGTSMATPMVAGAAALLRQHQPDLTAIQVKAILTNSSDAVVKNVTGEEKATAFETGSGRLNIENALNATTYAEDTNMVFKECYIRCGKSNKLMSSSATEGTWTAQYVAVTEGIQGEVTPSEVTVVDGTPADFKLTVTLPTSLAEGWHFGQLIWTNGSGDKVTQAIAVSNLQVDTALLNAEASDIDNSQKRVVINSTNTTDESTLNYSLQIAGNAKFVADSLVVTGADNATATESDTFINVTAELEAGAATLASGSAPFEVDLATGEIAALDCSFSEGCDEFIVSTDFSFKHYGQSYTSIMLNENGVVVPGDSLPEGSKLYSNKALPDDGKPDAIIAAFWSDFDLLDSTVPNDTGGGSMYMALYEHEGTNFMVVQWEKIKLWNNVAEGADAAYLGISNLDVEFSFQLIIEENSENKWIRYLSIPEQPRFYTVGMENHNASLGTTYWHSDNTGTDGESSVTTDDVLAISNSAGAVSIAVDIEQVSSEETLSDDVVSVNEDSSVEFDVLENDLGDASAAMLITKVADAKVITPLYISDTVGRIVDTTLTIVNNPSNGVVEITDGYKVKYTPNANFDGTDTFVYSVEDSFGEVAQATATINVVGENDMPEGLVITIPESAEEGKTIELSASATDVDSDLVYTWTLPSELSLVTERGSSGNTATGATISVKVGSLNKDSEVRIGLTVTDGEFSIIEQRTIKLKQKEEGILGLSLGTYLQLLLLSLVGVRVRRKYLAK